MRPIFHSSSVETKELSGFLKFFYITWQVLFTVIFVLSYMTCTRNHQEKNYLLYTLIIAVFFALSSFLSYLFGIRIKFWLMGMIDTDLEVKSFITWKVFTISFFASITPIFFIGKNLNDWQVFFVFIFIPILLFWISGKFIHIKINEQEKIIV